MINLEKIKHIRKVPAPHFKRTCPCTILPSPFFNFSDRVPRSPPGEVGKIYCLL